MFKAGQVVEVGNATPVIETYQNGVFSVLYTNTPDNKPFAQNLFMDLDGTLKSHKFPTSGLWQYDGQIYFLPKENR